MSPRTRRKQKNRSRIPLIAGLALLCLLAGWFWQHSRKQSELAQASAPVVQVPVDDSRVTAPLALPDPAQTRMQPAEWPGFLPAEARQTLRLIAQGGPFPHPQDGSVFGNREGRLPSQARGYYREYTVDTPGLNHRGARRIVTGGHPPKDYYYTADHYESFRQFDPPGAAR